MHPLPSPPFPSPAMSSMTYTVLSSNTGSKSDIPSAKENRWFCWHQPTMDWWFYGKSVWAQLIFLSLWFWSSFYRISMVRISLVCISTGPDHPILPPPSWVKTHHREIQWNSTIGYNDFNNLFLLLQCAKVFGLWIGEFFPLFFQRIQTQHQNLRCILPISNFWRKNILLLTIALFANFKAKFGRNGSKKEKRVYFTSIFGLGGSILSKESKSLYPNCTINN
jgi:hypothetical protein